MQQPFPIVGPWPFNRPLLLLSADRASRRELRDWAGRSGSTILESSVAGPFWRREYHFLIRKE